MDMFRLNTNLGTVVSSMTGKLQGLTPGGAIHDTMMRTIATTVLGEMKTRIHEKGMAADGSSIGKYSNKPIYVSAKANPGKSFGRPIGKTGKSKFKSGKKKGADHTSRYFAEGYLGYKNAIGRNQLGTVNLSLSGQMNAQFTLQATANGYGLGWSGGNFLMRAKHFEKKYGKKIWALTEAERAVVKSTAQNFVKDAFS